mmetsp:Transcript_26205/g.47971  ORF Transcript_26205/g.47971 Transcript_26205/m.47971 type:complete len:267 (+) Transcript_26205:355-1155(+)
MLTYLEARQARQGPSFTYEIIVVDDGSKDNTRGVVLDFTQRVGFDVVRLLRLSKNGGKGHAVKRGMLAARGSFLLMADADGATRFSDLERLEIQLDRILIPNFAPRAATPKSSAVSATAISDSLALATSGVGAAFGSRAHMERTVKRSALRTFLMKGFHMLVLFVAGGKIRDTQCGFKLFSRRAAAVIFSNLRLRRWCFDVEVVLLCRFLGVPIAEVDVTWTEVPGSKLRVMSVVHMALELLLIKVSYQIARVWRVASEIELGRKN